MALLTGKLSSHTRLPSNFSRVFVICILTPEDPRQRGTSLSFSAASQGRLSNLWLPVSSVSWPGRRPFWWQSCRRAETLELVALCSAPPYLVFLPHAVRLRPDIRFLPKVVSDFHMSSDILLPDFYPHPSSPEERILHTLDVKRALLFYLHRTRSPGRVPNLFVSYAAHHLG